MCVSVQTRAGFPCAHMGRDALEEHGQPTAGSVAVPDELWTASGGRARSWVPQPSSLGWEPLAMNLSMLHVLPNSPCSLGAARRCVSRSATCIARKQRSCARSVQPSRCLGVARGDFVAAWTNGLLSRAARTSSRSLLTRPTPGRSSTSVFPEPS